MMQIPLIDIPPTPAQEPRESRRAKRIHTPLLTASDVALLVGAVARLDLKTLDAAREFGAKSSSAAADRARIKYGDGPTLLVALDEQTASLAATLSATLRLANALRTAPAKPASNSPHEAQAKRRNGVPPTLGMRGSRHTKGH